MHHATIFLISAVSLFLIGMCFMFYYDNNGIRNYTRRKSWCRLKGYTLKKVKTRGWGNEYEYVGEDADGHQHSIPEEICRHNTFRDCLW